MQSVHVQHVSQLLLQVVSVLKSRHSSFSLREIDSCHRICLHLLHELLRMSQSPTQPSSLASTPSLSSLPSFPPTPTPTPTPTSPSTTMTSLDMLTNYRSLGQVTPDEENNLLLSYGDTILQVYDDYLSFFTEFLGSRVSSNARTNHRSDTTEDLHASFSSVCSTLILLVKLILRFDTISAPMESGEQHSGPLSTAGPPAAPLPPWLSSLMEACRDCSKPTLTLVALETLLMLVEMATTRAYETPNQGGVLLLSSAIECRVITPRMAEKMVLTQQFVKVRVWLDMHGYMRCLQWNL